MDRKDISNIDVLRQISIKIFGESRASNIILSSNSAKARQALRDNVDELIQRGGFGVPTVFIDREMYFGVDRMVFVERTLAETPHSSVVVSLQHTSKM